MLVSFVPDADRTKAAALAYISLCVACTLDLWLAENNLSHL